MLFWLLVVGMSAFIAGALVAVLPEYLEVRHDRKKREVRAHWELKLSQEGWTRPWAS